MATKDGKFGTFGGVFTPSLLTILGVIMYMRLPWVVGSSGLYAGVGIILVAHVISVSTGLSISSIATDKSVGAGGPYYIISRSLGLPIGGTLGLALFFGLSFSISLYVIGFSESFLGYVGVEPTPNAIRFAGTITVILLTVLTFISTELAIKTQYLILGAIAISLLSIFLGSPSEAQLGDGPHLHPIEEGPSMAALFGIFFPAVTGFTAGVNMSGDLRDPRRSLPVGTLAAIGTGLLVYLSLALYLTLRIDGRVLVSDPEILLHIALSPEAVVAGIWGATLSSALGSILGAPRILQAVSADGVTPKIFAKGYGPTNEPRNALICAFVIGEAGILIAELDVIAALVSMVFIATYGFLNLSAFIESWASPDFRPDFKIPKWVSLLGALTCLLMMVQLNLAAMFGATLLLSGLFVYLQRRQLALESGDTWEGIWSTLVRAGLHRMSRHTRQQRNWRPNILAFRRQDEEPGPMLRLASVLISGSGMLVDVPLKDPRRRAPRVSPTEDDVPTAGFFTREMESKDLHETIDTICRFHGFPGLEPNTILLNWSHRRPEGERFVELLDRLIELDRNLLLFAEDQERGLGQRRRVDVWWRPEDGSLGLSIALARFVTKDSSWSGVRFRFFSVTDDSSEIDSLRTGAERALEELRLGDADLDVLHAGVERRSIASFAAEISEDADLTIVALPKGPFASDERSLREIDRMLEAVGTALLIRGSMDFAKAVRIHGARMLRPSLPTIEDDTGALGIPELMVPEDPILGEAALDYAARQRELMQRFFEDAIVQAHVRHDQLFETLEKTIEKHFSLLRAALGQSNPNKRRKAKNRAQSSFLIEAKRALGEFEEKSLGSQRSLLSGKLRAALESDIVDRGSSAERVVARTPEEFRVRATDPPQIKLFKRWRVLAGWVSRTAPSYRFSLTLLEEHYLSQLYSEVLGESVRLFGLESAQLAVQVGKILNAAKGALTLASETLESREGGSEAQEALIERESARVRERIASVVEGHREQIKLHRKALELRTRLIAQAYADDLLRFDVATLATSERTGHLELDEIRAHLLGSPDRFHDRQLLLFRRARLALALSEFHQRVGALLARTEEALRVELRSSLLGELESLSAALGRYLADPKEEPGEEEVARAPLEGLTLDFDRAHRFDPEPILEALIRESEKHADELPDTTPTLTDEAVRALEEGAAEGEPEMMEISVRRLCRFLLEAEVVTAISKVLTEARPAIERARSVAQDVVRLLTFHQNELAEEDPEEARAQLLPAARKAKERIDLELERITAFGPKLEETIAGERDKLLKATDPYALTRSAESLDQQVRRRQGQRAVFGAQSLLVRGARGLRGALVEAIYQRSAGVLLARRLASAERHFEHRGVRGELASLVASASPDEAVLRDLPHYYRQLFVGASVFNETFWVERPEALAQAGEAVLHHRQGRGGTLLVTGDPGSGKTALARRAIEESAREAKSYWVHPPEGGSAEPSRLDQAIQATLESKGEVSEVLDALPRGSALVFDDLELWWERRPGGLAAVDRLLELTERHGERLLFVLIVSAPALSLWDRLRPISARALAVLRAHPMDARALKEIISLRHASTGLKIVLDGTPEEELSEWRLARLFARLFDYSQGSVGVALSAWIAHIEKVEGERIHLRAPAAPSWKQLDDVEPRKRALMLALLLHKRASLARLSSATGEPAEVLSPLLLSLLQVGLVSEPSEGIYALSPAIRHGFLERLRERGVIA